MAMAFVDELLTAAPGTRVVMVDRRQKAGGHWNDAYSFVRLHQPALFYGVNSENLGDGGDDLASLDVIQSYYARVLKKLCDTGWVRFYGGYEYEGEGRLRSLSEPSSVVQVNARREVDGTYSQVTIPKTHTPAFEVEPGQTLVPVNDLDGDLEPWSRFIVIGAGKTGIDAILQLRARAIPASRITWVVSRDAWLFNRELLGPERFGREFSGQMWEVSRATSVDDFFDRFERRGWVMRLDPNRKPESFRCATVSASEFRQLREIEDVVRLGRVQHIGADTVTLNRGTIATGGDVLHVDCTADGLRRRPPTPVFSSDRVTLQPIIFCQPTMSAAMIAYIEATQQTDEEKNGFCRPVGYPRVRVDYPTAMVVQDDNMQAWIPRHAGWLFRKRLSILGHASVRASAGFLWGAIRWGPRARRNAEKILDRHRASMEGVEKPEA